MDSKLGRGWLIKLFEFNYLFRIAIKENKFYIGNIISTIVFDEDEVINIAINPDRQKKGLAKLLIKNSMERIITHMVKKIFLEVLVDNKQAKLLYNSLGLEKICYRNYYYKKTNRTVDAVNFCVNPKILLKISKVI